MNGITHEAVFYYSKQEGNSTIPYHLIKYYTISACLCLLLELGLTVEYISTPSGADSTVSAPSFDRVRPSPGSLGPRDF